MEHNESHLQADVTLIRQRSPLVHNITNFVVMNNTANALLALGASPVMAHAREEVEDMTRLAGALVINVGTLSSEWVEAMEMAMRAARETGVPIVYDPVGAGATPYRNTVNERLLKAVTPTLIRGNGSEIMALASLFSVGGDAAQTKGVDSTAGSEAAVAAAMALSLKLNTVVVVSGVTDYIVKGNEVLENRYGTHIMARVTGMGCTASALCGAFLAVNGDAHQAAMNAMTLMGVCGERALTKAEGSGSFQVAFLDAVYNF